MIFVTGDTHADFKRFNTENFPEQKQMSRDDYVIICGDFGGLWDGSKSERYWLKWLEDKPFTTLFIDGNHENYTLLNSFPVTEWHGGKVHAIRPHLLHLMRGQHFEIDGRTFFTMGGAASHDIQDGILDPDAPNFKEEYKRKAMLRQLFRVRGLSWWPEEMPSEDEYQEARDTLGRIGHKVDYVLTHCCPTSIENLLFSFFQPDALTNFLEEIMETTDFKNWIFGHYHEDRRVDARFVLLYEQIVELP